MATTSYKDFRTCLLWAKYHFPVFSKLSTNITREICSYFPPLPTLVWVTSNTLSYFVFPALTKSTQLAKTLQVTSDSSWVVLDPDRLFVCGGCLSKCYVVFSAPWSTAYLIERTGSVEELPAMLMGRNASGLVLWQATVYVFGSCKGHGNKSESTSLLEKQWQWLPNMHKIRYAFTPAIFGEAIYLCGGWEAVTVEVYRAGIITVLPLELPETGRTLAYVHQNKLVLLTYTFITEIDASGAVSSKQHTVCLPDTNTSAVVFQDWVYFYRMGKVCRCGVTDGEPVPLECP